MPFLWWGFRVSDTSVRNALAADMAAHRRTLDWHLAPMQFARRLASAQSRLKEAGKESGTELVKDLFKKAIEAIPGIGIAATLMDLAVSYGDKAAKAGDALREQHRVQNELRRVDLLQAAQASDTAILAVTLDDLGGLLAPGPDVAPLPIVLFCDDAQHAREGEDEGAMRLLGELWERAHLGNWPLLLVLTHWEVQWHQDIDTPDRQSTARNFSGAARSSQFSELITLAKESALGGLVHSGLPNLPADDIQLLLDQSDGNPQFLVELISMVREAPAWRRGQGGGRLTPHAKQEIARQATSLVNLIVNRLKSENTPEGVRQAVAISSLQGVEFLCHLTNLAASALDMGDLSDSLARAEHPHRLVSGVDSGVAAFSQRAYLEAATTLLSQHVGDPKEVEALLLETALKVADDTGQWLAMSGSERTATLGVIAGIGGGSSNTAHRLRGGQALLDLTVQAMRAEKGGDFARAAHFAMIFERGIGQRWSVADFSPYHVDKAREAIGIWLGVARTEYLAQLAFAHAQVRHAESATIEASYVLGVQSLALGQAVGARGDLDRCLQLYRSALSTLRKVHDSEKNRESLSDIAMALGVLAEVEARHSLWSDSHEHAQEALSICRQVHYERQTFQSLRDVWIATRAC